MDWWEYPGGVEYFQKGMSIERELLLLLPILIIRTYILTECYLQMWVNIDDWHENPEIIHTKFN